MKTEDTEVLGKLSKVKARYSRRTLRTACTIVHHYNNTQYCSTETVLLIFPFFHSSRPTDNLSM